jgi:hypothetical protein
MPSLSSGYQDVRLGNAEFFLRESSNTGLKEIISGDET